MSNRIQIQPDPVNALYERIEQLEDVLRSMVIQYGDHLNGPRIGTGGMSALEGAFEALGWDDPHSVESEYGCDEPGCDRWVTRGTPTPNGYRSTCSDHAPKVEEINP